MMRLLRSPVPVVLACSAILLVAVAVLLGSVATDRARASHEGAMDAMSIDMDPGGSPANTATSLGSIEFCARINENDTLDADEDAVDEVAVDITAKGIPAYDDGGTPNDPADDSGGFIGFQFQVDYDESQFTIQSEDVHFLLNANAGSSILNVSEPVPDVDGNGTWLGSALDTSPTVPEGGAGVIHRLTVVTDEDASSRQSVVALAPGYNAHLDASGEAFLPDTVGFANLAVNQPCGVPVTPGPSPTPGLPPTNVPPPSSAATEPPTYPSPNPLGAMEAMSVDVDPSAAPANTATSIGSIEQCARINENGVLDGDEDTEDAVDIDITAEGIPAYSDGGTPGNPLDDSGGFIGYQYVVKYDEDQFTIQDENDRFLLQANSGSSIFPIHEAVPDADGNDSWLGSALDTGISRPEDGDGVIQRLTVATDETAVDGQYSIDLDRNNAAHLDALGAAFAPKALGFANIAVNQACGALVTPAPPTPSPTPAPTPVPPPPTPVSTAAPPTPTPCCIQPTPAPGQTPTPAPFPTAPPGPPPFLPGGVLCFEDFASPTECDGDPAPGAASDIRTRFCIGRGPDCSAVPGASREGTVDGIVFFAPTAFEPADGVPIGAMVGLLDSRLMMGLLNGPCDKPIGVRFTLLNASVDPANTISPKPAGQSNVMEPLAADADGNGLPDGIDRYPVFLRNAFDPDWDAGPDGVPNTADDVDGAQAPVAPIVRLGAFTKVFGNWISLQLLTFLPGTTLPFAGELVEFKPEFGYPTVLVVHDPTGGGGPLPISDICSPLNYDFVAFGKSWDNPCTGGPDTAETRGNCPDEFEFAIENAGYPLFPCDPYNNVDEDRDGVVNDGCPQVNAVPESGEECLNTTSDDLEDSSVNDGCPQVGDVSEGDYIGGTCSGLDEGGCTLRSNPDAEGTYNFITVAASARDADGDGWDNVIDTCPLDPNPDWNPFGIDPVNDPDNDGLPNECDPDPHTVSPQSPLTGDEACFETGIVGADEDGDCYSNRHDNCPLVANPLQQDVDGDAIGDACDPDPAVPNGERIILCMRFEAEVAAGAAATTSGPTYDLWPNCFGGGPLSPDGVADPSTGDATPTPQPTEADTGAATPTPTSTVLAETASPAQPMTGGGTSATGATVSPAPTVLGAVALPSAGGGEGEPSWPAIGASLSLVVALVGGGAFVRWRLARAIVRRE